MQEEVLGKGGRLEEAPQEVPFGFICRVAKNAESGGECLSKTEPGKRSRKDSLDKYSRSKKEKKKKSKPSCSPFSLYLPLFAKMACLVHGLD